MSTLRLAILGCGGFSRFHAQRLRGNADVKIVALCDLQADIVDRYIAANLPDYQPRPTVYTEPQRMYEHERLDAVMIVTPHTLHHQHVVQALSHRCHVFVEKPMVTHAPDAYDIAARAQAADRIVVVGYNSPCTPEFQYLRQTIRDKSLGELQLVHGYISQDWRRLTTNTWRQKPELSGGGMAYDSGAHLLNSLCWSVESRVARVFADLDNMDTPVDINASLQVRFENGVRATIAIGGNCPPYGSHMSFLFDAGRIDIDGWSGHWINVYKGPHQLKYPHITGEPQSPDDNFIDAILGKQAPATSPQNGIVHSELMDAIYESARTGQPASPQR